LAAELGGNRLQLRHQTLLNSTAILNPLNDALLSTVAKRLNIAEIVENDASYVYVIERRSARLMLNEIRGDRALRHQLDVDKSLGAQRTFPASRKGVFNQAIGRKSLTIIDATGGMGSDSLLMCLQGYRVTTLERNTVLALLLDDAFGYLGRSVWAQKHAVLAPEVVQADSIAWFKNRRVDADCIYLDPMFPAKRKASAEANKSIRLMQDISGVADNSAELLQAALATGVSRVVVKRPHYAMPVSGTPSDSFKGKLVRYDLYLQ
jgi:16S rRNA (guanine1516-N2)-methyltransferase